MRFLNNRGLTGSKCKQENGVVTLKGMHSDTKGAPRNMKKPSTPSPELTNRTTTSNIRGCMVKCKTMPESESPPQLDNQPCDNNSYCKYRSQDFLHVSETDQLSEGQVSSTTECERLSLTSNGSSESETEYLYTRTPNCQSPICNFNQNQLESSSPPQSLQLQQQGSNKAVPDPFPELSNSPLMPTLSFARTDSSYSLDSSFVNSAHSPKHTPKKRAIESSSPPSDTSSQAELQVWTDHSWKKTMLNFYNDDRSRRTLSVDDTVASSDACYMLVLKNQAIEDKSWAIVEYLSKFNLERSLEDHEAVLQVYRSWGHTEDNRFYFRKDFRKYEFFHNPCQFFPPNMLDTKMLKENANSSDLVSKANRQKNLLLQNLLDSDAGMPDIQGYLLMREGKKSWKKHYFVLRRSGLYYSTKGTSKEPRHLVLFSQVTDANIYAANNAKKTLGAPNNNCFCLKPLYVVNDIRELKCLCAEDEQSRVCWMTALRIVRYGYKLKENFKAACRREEKLKSIENHQRQSTGHSGVYVKQRVAVDFSTRAGPRVVSDPNEAMGIAIEEESNWRKKAAVRPSSSSHNSPTVCASGSFLSSSPKRSQKGLSSGIHMTQPWFHSGVTREEAVRIISEHGLIDGVFLLRESHSIKDTYVLSLAHNHKVKHCQIHKIEIDGNWYFSLDKGRTRFGDLLQLVEFYQLNANGLPTKLTHYITRLL